MIGLTVAYLAVGCVLAGFAMNTQKKPDGATVLICVFFWPAVLLIALGIKLSQWGSS